MPALARNTDPETSHAAARSVRKIAETRKNILELLSEYDGLTDEEIALQAQWRGWFTSSSGLRTRRAELVEQGLVCDSGNTRRMESGRRGIVWRRTEC